MTFKTSTINYFYSKVFYLLLFEGTFTSFFKDKKSLKSHKTIGINVFLLFLLDDRRIRIRISELWIRIREAQKHMDPTDPAPQQCLTLFAVQELEEQERLAATADVEEEMETGEVGALDTTNKKGNKKQKKKKAPVWKLNK
jgi:hypothetical protein